MIWLNGSKMRRAGAETMRVLLRLVVAGGVLAIANFGPAFAGAADRDEAWDALIVEAKKRGGVETVLDKSASCVFQRPDGMYVTFTRTLDNRTRVVCALASDSNFSACADWRTGNITYGWRADAAAQMRFSKTPPTDAELGRGPGLFQTLLSGLTSMMESGGANGYWRLRNGTYSWTTRR